MLDAAGLIEKHKSKGALVDTNLLVLWLVGSVNPRRITELKRTRDFEIGDFELLRRLIAWFGNLTSTPHVLAQVSDLSDLPGKEFSQIRELFKSTVEVIDEVYQPARELVKHPVFERHGLTDAAIARVSSRGVLVVTADVQLQLVLDASGIEALNFNHVRPLGW